MSEQRLGAPMTTPASMIDTATPLQDPFANPRFDMAATPTAPEPAHLKLTHKSSNQADWREDDKLEYNALDEKHGSMSSADNTSLSVSPVRSTDLADKRSSRYSEQKKQSRASRDLEKGYTGRHNTSNKPRSNHSNSRRSHRLDREEMDEARQRQESHAVKILLFLAAPVVGLSFLNAVWTMLSILITLLSQPVRLCASRPSFGQQLGGLLGPALNLQLKCIYTPLPPHANEDATYSTYMLVTVQLLSPVLSLGVMIASWVVAMFWFSSLIVGDPTGTDRRDDGSESLLMLRKFWEKWLRRSIREEFA